MRPNSVVNALLDRRRDEPGGIFAHVRRDDAWFSLTVDDVYGRAMRWGALLRARRCTEGEIVFLVLRDGMDQYAAFLGCMLAGCVPAFLPFLTPKQDPQLYWREHDELFRRVGSKALITYADNVGPIRARIPDPDFLIVTAEDLPEAAPDFIPSDRGGQNIALLQHSSGTTGLKKGVALSHDAVLDHIESYGRTIDFRRNDVVVSWLPLYHDMGLIACFILPLVRGGVIAYLDTFEWMRDPPSLLRAIDHFKATWVWLPNFAFGFLTRFASRCQGLDLGSMRGFINGSEPCKAATIDAFHEAFRSNGVRPTQLLTGYGMAETVLGIAQSPLGEIVSRLEISTTALSEGSLAWPAGDEACTTLLSSGRIIDGLEVTILGAGGEPLPEGRVGRIAISGRFLFSGYYKNPKNAFSDGRYVTGDLGLMWKQELYVTGRTDDVIIVHGKNLYAHDIEFLAQAIDGVKSGRAVALGVYNADSGSEDLVVMCEVAPEFTGLRTSLESQIRAQVEAQYGLSGTFVTTADPESLVKTTSGKLSRKQNLLRYLDSTKIAGHAKGRYSGRQYSDLH